MKRYGRIESVICIGICTMILLPMYGCRAGSLPVQQQEFARSIAEVRAEIATCIGEEKLNSERNKPVAIFLGVDKGKLSTVTSEVDNPRLGQCIKKFVKLDLPPSTQGVFQAFFHQEMPNLPAKCRLDADDIQKTVLRASLPIYQCFESYGLALTQDIRVAAVFNVGGDGFAKNLTFEVDDHKDRVYLKECIRESAHNWQFPPPGSSCTDLKIYYPFIFTSVPD